LYRQKGAGLTKSFRQARWHHAAVDAFLFTPLRQRDGIEIGVRRLLFVQVRL